MADELLLTPEQIGDNLEEDGFSKGIMYYRERIFPMMAEEARKDERERILKELAGLVDLRNKPETLCVKFLDWLESDLQALKG